MALSTPARAAEATGAKGIACEAADAAAINQFIAAEGAKSSTDGQIAAKLKERWCGLTEIGSPALDGIQARTSQSDVDWSDMSMFYDGQARVYVATATWKWTRQGFLDADTVICANNNIGGFDGLGIRFSGGDMNILGKAATAWGNPAKDSYSNDYGFTAVPHSQVGEYGVGFRLQDRATKLKSSTGACTNGQYDYNMFGGSATITFKALNACKNVQMYPGYIHTWDNTSVNTIGAGPYSFSIGWTSNGADWTKEENGPSARICP
jgi:hypothetical protein